MRSTDITKNNNRGFDLVIDGSSLYDLTIDTNLNDIDMSSIYNKSLSTECLVVDADVSGKTFNYVRYVEDYSDIESLTPVTDVPVSYYFQYQWATTGYTMFEDRMEKGWSAEFITNFNVTPPTGTTEDIIFYMGKTQNASGHTSDFVDNNFVISIKGRKLLFKTVKYEKDCDCEGATNVIKNVIYKSNYVLPTGTTLHHMVIVFQRDMILTGDDLYYKGNNIDCDEFPNNHWYDGKNYRMGTIKIFIDGLLRESFEVEEAIFRDTVEDLPHVQGWGLADESTYVLSVEHGVAGSYTGDLIRGRFYICPLRADEIRTNFELFAEEYNITNTLTSC